MSDAQDSIWLQHLADAYGNRIAKELDLYYSGYQPTFVNEQGDTAGNYMIFIDKNTTRSGFTAQSLEEARAKKAMHKSLFQGQG